jgi:hypothetical protein
MVVQVTQILDALAVQPLRLVDQQQPLPTREQRDQLLGELEPVRAPRISASKLPVEPAGDMLRSAARCPSSRFDEAGPTSRRGGSW